MIAAASLLILLLLSMLVTRVGAVALRLTGMSDAAARFQARSALSGAGFTTSESEQVITHPVRRRIVGILILLGNVGLVAASGTLIVSLVGIENNTDAWRLLLLAGGLIILCVLASNKILDRLMCGTITWALSRWTDLETRDFTTLLHLDNDYRIAELIVETADWMAGKTLREMALKKTGILVLGITTLKGHYEGTPDADRRLLPGETLLIYGLPGPLAELDCRCKLEEESA